MQLQEVYSSNLATGDIGLHIFTAPREQEEKSGNEVTQYLVAVLEVLISVSRLEIATIIVVKWADGMPLEYSKSFCNRLQDCWFTDRDGSSCSMQQE